MLLGVSPELVSHWEQGIRKPAPVVCRLLDQIKSDLPRFWGSLVKRKIVA
jgi:DNA-binding transcriptional regulator YiaG